MVKVANFVFNSFKNDSRVLKESLSLTKNGYAVTVVPHHDKDVPQKEKIEELNIRRVAYLDRSVTKGKMGKLKAYLAYVKESVLFAKNFDILHCNDINTLPIGVLIKKFYNKEAKIVYDAHEYETETYALYGFQKRVVKWTEKKLIKYCDKVITVSDSIANDYVKLYGIEKPALVLNTPPFKDVKKQDKFREAFTLAKEKRVFLYQGGLTKNRGIELLLELFSEFKEEDQNVIVFMGYGDLEGLISEYANKYTNIYLHEAVSPQVLLDYTVSADVGISTIEDSCLSYRYCLPNKMFEYIMAEVPLLVSNLPEMCKIVEEDEIGIVLKEETLLGLRASIKQIECLDRENLSQNLKKVKKIYNWQKQEEILLEVYKELSI